jgi:hypothetical protein
MNKKQSMVIVLILLIACHSSLFAETGIDKALVEINNRFTYKDRPIHPGLIAEFNGLLSDPWNPIITSLDIAAAYDTNQYQNSDVRINENGLVFLQRDGKDNYFCYEWLGKLNNGLHVVEIWDGVGGCSGVFMSLFFVKFEKGYGLTPEGQRHERLLMTIVRNAIVGDRDDGKITVLPDKVILGKSKYRNRPVVLEFSNLR